MFYLVSARTIDEIFDAISKWFNSFLGFNAAMSGHGILLPLYTAALGGTARDFGLITAAYNAVSIGALVFWGKRSDRSGQRKRFILIGMAFTGIFLCFFPIAQTSGHLIALNALLGFFSIAGIPATTMLIVELHSRGEWEKKLGEYNTYCGVGLAIGLLIGTLLLLVFNFQTLYLIFSTTALLSALIGFLLIQDPVITLERLPVVTTVPRLGIVERVRVWALSVHQLPSLSTFSNFRKRLRFSLTQDLPLYYLSVFLLFTASNMVFVPLPLYLRYLGLSGSLIFLLYLINNLSATTTYRIAVKRITKTGNARIMFLITGVRGLLFAGVAIIKLLNPTHAMVLIGVVLILAGLSWAFMNIASSALTLELSPLGHQGQALGGLNALIGGGVVCGALFGGFLTDTFGYYISCLCAAGVQSFGVGLLRIISGHRKGRSQ